MAMVKKTSRVLATTTAAWFPRYFYALDARIGE